MDQDEPYIRTARSLMNSEDKCRGPSSVRLPSAFRPWKIRKSASSATLFRRKPRSRRRTLHKQADRTRQIEKQSQEKRLEMQRKRMESQIPDGEKK